MILNALGTGRTSVDEYSLGVGGQVSELIRIRPSLHTLRHCCCLTVSYQAA